MWSELVALWSIVSYGITADPLPEDVDGVTFKWQIWRWALLLRVVVAAVFSYWICHSVIVSAWLATLGEMPSTDPMLMMVPVPRPTNAGAAA